MNTHEIIEFIGEIFTRDNITFILALIGSFGTCCTLIAQRKNLSLSIQYYSYKNKSLLTYISFTNHSRLPISILNVSIVLNDVCYPCVYIPTKVCETIRRSGKEVISCKEDYSIQFPISLSSLAGSSGYLYFDKLPKTFPDVPTTVTIEVSTNRGKAKKMILSVPEN
ncbi:hypothetical protein AALA13_16580 [Lachnospiraceae bacterium 50-23]